MVLYSYSIAVLSDTSNVPQHDIGSYLRIHIGGCEGPESADKYLHSRVMLHELGFYQGLVSLATSS